MSEKKYKDVEFNTWEPKKEGDFIAGVYVKMHEEVGVNKSNVYDLRQENGKIISAWGSTVLNGHFDKVQIGDDIKIIYLGIKRSESGRKAEYKDFKIQRAVPEELTGDEHEETPEEESDEFPEDY